MEDIRVDSLYFYALGTGDESAKIDSIRLYRDEDADGTLSTGDSQIGATIYQASIQDDDTLKFKNLNAKITAGTNEKWIVVYDLNTNSGDIDKTFQVKLEGFANIKSVGVTSGESIVASLENDLILGGRITITSAGSITIAEGPNNPGGGTISNSDTDVSLIQVQMDVSDTEPIVLDSLFFLHQGSGSLAADVTTVKLIEDVNNSGQYESGTDNLLRSITVQSSQDDTVKFSGLSKSLSQNSTNYFLVVYDYNGTASADKTYSLKIVDASFVSAVGQTSSQSISVTATTGFPVAGNTFTVSSSGSLSMGPGNNNPGASNEPASATDLVILQVKLTASSVENININSIRIDASGTGHDVNNINNNGVSLYNDVNGDGKLDGGDTQIDQSRNYNADDGYVTFTTTGEVINAGTTENWILVYDLDGSASEGATFRAGVLNSAVSAQGSTSGETINPNGIPFTGNYKTIATTGSMTVTVGANNPGNISVDRATTQVTVFQFDVAASSVEDITLNTVQIEHQGTGNPATEIANNGVHLYYDANGDGSVDGGDTQLGQGNYSGSTITFSSLNHSIQQRTTHGFIVVYDFNGTSAHNNTFQARLAGSSSISGQGQTSLNNVTVNGSFPVSGGVVTVTANAVISASATDIGPGIINPGSDNVGLLRIDLQADKNTGFIASMRIDNRSSFGAVSSSDVDLVRIYREDGTTPGFQSSEDTQIGSGALSSDGNGGNVTINFSSNLDVDNSGVIIYVAYDISPDATPTDKVGVRLENSSYIGAANNQTSFNSGDYPLGTSNDHSLPVELSAFHIQASAGIVEISWSTESETGNLGFGIERKKKEDTDYTEIVNYRDDRRLQGLGNSSVGKDYSWSDESVEIATYEYRLVQYEADGRRVILAKSREVAVTELKPEAFSLEQNYPNPFNPSTTIGFILSKKEKISLIIYNAIGQEVVKLVNNVEYNAGEHHVEWHGKNNAGHSVASGIYIYILEAGSRKAAKKMILMK